MLEEINVLKEKLDKELLENQPYETILCTSKQIDDMLIQYYKKENFIKDIN